MKGAMLRSGEVLIDPIGRTLTRDGKRTQPSRKVLDLILFLIDRRGVAVMREHIEKEIWPDVRVSKASLRWLLKEVRRSLGDNGADQRYIETTRGYGLRWVSDVEVIGSAADELDGSAADEFDGSGADGVDGPASGEAAPASRELADTRARHLETGVRCAELIRIAENQLRAGKFNEARDALHSAAKMTERIAGHENR